MSAEERVLTGDTTPSVARGVAARFLRDAADHLDRGDDEHARVFIGYALPWIPATTSPEVSA